MTHATLATAYGHGPGKSVWLTGHPTRPARPRGLARADLRELAEDGAFGAALARTLCAALAPRRWEPWNPNNDHRAYPSPRSHHLTDAVLRLGERRWTIDPVREVLEGDSPLPPGIDSASVELRVHPDRLPEGYGSLRDAVALLEAGHASSAIAEAGSAAGLAAMVTLRVAVCDAEGALLDSPAGDDERPWPTGVSGVVADIALRPGVDPTWPWDRVVADRSAGLSPRGLSADPRPLPAATLRRLTENALTAPPGSLADGSAARALRHRLAVRGVTGFDDGLYGLRAGRLLLEQADPTTERLQSAFRYGPRDVDVIGMNVVWVITADLCAGVRAHGPTAYAHALLAAGATAQHICSAAAAAGLFCRPVRSYEEPATEAAVHAGPGEDALYMLLIGRPRALDFCYDLTDPEQPRWP